VGSPVTEAVSSLAAQLAPEAWAAAGAAVIGVVALAMLLRRRARARYIAQVKILTEPGSTGVDPSGAVRSVQTADLTMPHEALDAIWTPMHLERLARTYWRFLTRVTLGLIRVAYTARKRYVVFIGRPFVLLSFQAPEYQMDERGGVVRWRMERGVLVSRSRRGEGYLQIDIRRSPPTPSRASTSSSRTPFCARSPGWTWPNPGWGGSPRTRCPKEPAASSPTRPSPPCRPPRPSRSSRRARRARALSPGECRPRCDAVWRGRGGPRSGARCLSVTASPATP
jgi:hypothetical protein